VNRAELFLLLARHPHHRQRFPVALHKAIESQAERFGIQAVGLHPLIALIQLLRTDHVALDFQRSQLPLQPKAKPARFVDGVNLCAAFLLELGRPGQKRFLLEPLRRLRIGPSLLANHHVKLLVHINSKLDRSAAGIKLSAGFLE
jgi:hypothetical protein